MSLEGASEGRQARVDVVLVHGLAGSARWWSEVARAVGEHHRVDAVDVPRLWPRRDPVEWLAARVGAHDEPVLVGHSLGGLLAAAVAARRPADVRALALIAPAGVPVGRSLFSFGLPLAGALRLAGPRFLPRLTADALRAGPLSLLLGARYALAADLEPELALVDVPTLLLWGERDPILPRALAERWHAALPQARLVVLDDVGHVPPVERPQAVAAELLDFLEEVERQPR